MLIYLIEQEGQNMADPNQQPDLDAITRERGSAFVFSPQVEQEPDGSWCAQYPAGQERVRALGREIAERSTGLNDRLA